MNKLLKYIESDTIDKDSEYYLTLGTSIGSWCLLLFFLIPTLISSGNNIFFKDIQLSTAISGTVTIVLYYILNPIISTVFVKFQNRKLVKKPLKFRKIYSLTISFCSFWTGDPQADP